MSNTLSLLYIDISFSTRLARSRFTFHDTFFFERRDFLQTLIFFLFFFFLAIRLFYVFFFLSFSLVVITYRIGRVIGRLRTYAACTDEFPTLAHHRDLMRYHCPRNGASVSYVCIILSVQLHIHAHVSRLCRPSSKERR